MLDWGFGLGAFGMFFLYDWNRVFLKKRWFVPLFAAGNLLLAVVGGRMVYACISSGFKVQSAWLLPGAIFLAILVYTLYFASVSYTHLDVYKRQGKNNADDYRNHNIIFYCNPVQGNLTAYNFPVNETGVFKSIVCNQFVSQTYITINNALYQRIAADNSSPFSAWELK